MRSKPGMFGHQISLASSIGLAVLSYGFDSRLPSIWISPARDFDLV